MSQQKPPLFVAVLTIAFFFFYKLKKNRLTWKMGASRLVPATALNAVADSEGIAWDV